MESINVKRLVVLAMVLLMALIPLDRVVADGITTLQLTQPNAIGTRISTDAELLAFVRDTWDIRLPDVQVCANHSTPARAFCDAYFARSPVSVWMASRGFGGKSMLLSLLSLTEAVTLKADVNILGGSGEQSQRVLGYMDKFWAKDTAPKSLLASDPAKRETKLTSGAKIQALMASQRSVRGPHPQRLRLDEIDEMDITILDASMGQTLSAPGIPTQTVMSSTRQYMDGTMTAMLQRAGEKGWPIHEWCYKESLEPHGWLSQAEVDQKRSEVTAAMWLAEYDLQEPAPNSRAIQPAAVAAMFRKALGEYAGDPHEYIEIEGPVPGGTYSTGADWARKQDWTEIITYRTDVNPVRLIAYERTGRLDWPVMVEKYNSRIRRFQGQGYHDGTGIGDVVAGYLTVPATGVIMVGRARADLLTNYIAAIERGEIAAPFIRALEAEHRYASVEDVYAGGDGHLPDGIAAGALAWMGMKYRGLSEEEVARIGSNKIDVSKLSDSLLDALRASGVDVEKMMAGIG
jgi:hypothetical protein